MTQPQDIRVLAWSFGRRARDMATAYRLLEAGQADAVRVFAALRSNEWGVKAALADGLRGVDIVVQADPVTQVAFTGGAPYPKPLVRRTLVAANGGTI